MQPNQQPFAFDPSGLLILPGVVGPNSAFSINQNGDAVFQDVNTLTLSLAGVDLQTTINDLVTNETFQGPQWTPLTYQNGWGDLSTSDPKLQVRLTENGRMLYICGSMAVGTMTDGTIVANIADLSMRPANNISFPVWVHYTTAPTGFYAAGLPPRFDVEANGNVRCWDINQTGGVANQVIVNGTIPLDAVSGSSSPVPTTYTKTYSATGSQCFDSSGNNRAPYNNGFLYQGYYSSTNGNQFSVINFNSTQIKSDLSGATISKVQVYLKNNTFYNNSGGTAVIGYSKVAAGSGSYNYANISPDWNTQTFSVGASQWVTISNSIGSAFQSGTAVGIALGKAPSNSLTYYGSFCGYGQSGAPQLKITYSK